ncbi:MULTISPECIES: efflux transporter outer membrane subunit [unclassified Acidovorax]|uniref:efflux transporter outer membrane subunit n=1 Tax=unclassified Acidovorax TaxID=2684926 RepID=UPI002882F6B5|nr:MULTISPECIES: efflux transporter outer membrane subunit [unclassified Acidovorax]
MNAHFTHSTARALLALTLPLWLGACALQRPAAQVDAPAPPGWQAPLPHQGNVADLARWWERQDDPLLVELITAAQGISPTVAQARSRIEQARATQTAARAALLPSLEGQANASRGFNQTVGGIATTAQATLQAGWEIDLFGGNAAARDAARERLAGAGAQWHEARVSVAAEVALQLSSWRQCTRQLAVAESDARSRGETARLSGESERAGFTAPATAALADASFAEARVRAAQQRMQCEIDVKTLVALTGQPEPALRTRLAAAPAQRAPDALFNIPSLPAQTIAQRPDVYAAEREVAAASAEVGNARAQRYPRITLGGSIGRGTVRTGGTDVSSNTWSIGPLALTVPIFDAGQRAAQVDAASARYEEAVAAYRGAVRQAVSEVEQALVRLDSTAARSTDARRAADGYRRSFDGTEARWRAGLASLVELEDARRTALASDTALVALEQERMAAWIALYRAAGGGWDGVADSPPATPGIASVRETRSP